MKQIILILLAIGLSPALSAQKIDEHVAKTKTTDSKKRQQNKEDRGGRMSRSNQTAIQDFFASLTDEERQELRELRRSNPQEAKKMMAEKLKKYNNQREARVKYLNDLIGKYRQTSDKEDKEKLHAEIKKMVTEDFETNLRERKRQLVFLERRLQTERERYEARSKNSDEIIQKSVDKLTKVQ